MPEVGSQIDGPGLPISNLIHLADKDQTIRG